MEFNESKQTGDVIENEIIGLISKKYQEAYTTKHKGKFSDYDIYIPEIEWGIEVKGDYKSAETGNLVVEIEMPIGNPSALSVTKAKYWVFVEGYRLIWIEPIDIYRYLLKNDFRVADFVGDGDNTRKLAYLIPHNPFVLHVHYLESGFVSLIPKKSPIYFNNFSNRTDLYEKNKIKTNSDIKDWSDEIFNYI